MVALKMDILLKIIFWSGLIAVAWPYTAYPIFLWLFSRKPVALACKGDASLREPMVSVVIAAYNEESVITGRIRNLLAVDYPREKLELIIVSDGSTDRTNALVERFGPDGVKLVVVPERGGKINALNTAVPLAKGEIVVLSDANTEFRPDAVRKLVRPFQDAEVGGVCGHLIFQSVKGSTSGEMEGAYWDFESRLKEWEGRRGALLGANGGIYALRHALWTPLPAGTIIEDFLVAMRILQYGKKVVFARDAIAFEDAAAVIEDEFTRRVRIGAGGYQALFMLLPMLRPTRGFPCFAFFSRKVLRWLCPFFLLGVFLSNFFLVGSPFYTWLFVAQVAGYSLAILSILAQRRLPAVPLVLRLGGYFLLMNIALLIGFFRWLTARQSVQWQRTPRRLVSDHD